jgi:outer membrane protein OmpA-like peptidoglycan-associated protein
MNDATGRATTGIIYTSRQDEGYLLGGALGWKMDQLRLELGLDFANAGIKSVSLNNANSTSASGSMRNTSGMLNAFWDFRTGTPFVPYIGIGVGATSVSLNNVTRNCALLSNSSDLEFAYQPMVGVNFFVTPNLALGLQYRYFASVDPSFSFPGGRVGVKNESHNVLASLTWYFGAPEAPPPPVQPAPVVYQPQLQPAPLPPVVYTVFFDFNRAALTPEARRVVQQAAADFQQHGATRIALTGNTDTVGSQGYNLELSRRRALSIREYLMQLGIPASEIAVSAHGKSDLRVPTPDGVREPQNRRVEIVIP